MPSGYVEGRRGVPVGVGHHRDIANKRFTLLLAGIARRVREKLNRVSCVWFCAGERASGRGEDRSFGSRYKIKRNSRACAAEYGIAPNRITVGSAAAGAFDKPNLNTMSIDESDDIACAAV